ncbi:Aste57867_23449 [Aphanomyces stellatus]|uniref:Aste57867_23449 protein n=1 Tax=Aphanomyces stellatus TaxID=120398 RepID=A0A485LN44_9STRA|nr:hypothetical protein As57867_023378 [Aphanomyces stellatus]VFU00095.1 Aste57867_23449 [Aphanomyces stellatus]
MSGTDAPHPPTRPRKGNKYGVISPGRPVIFNAFAMKLAAIDSHAMRGMSDTLDHFFPSLNESGRKEMAKLVAKFESTSRRRGRAALEQVKTVRNEGIPVANIMLQLKAREVASERGILPNQFLASADWCNGFKSRHGLSLRQGQDKQEGGEAAVSTFSKGVREIMRANNISVVFNADRTGVFYEYLPKKTVNIKGENTVRVRCGGKDK